MPTGGILTDRQGGTDRGSKEKSFAPRVHRIIGVGWGSSETLRLAIWKKEKNFMQKTKK